MKKISLLAVTALSVFALSACSEIKEAVEEAKESSTAQSSSATTDASSSSSASSSEETKQAFKVGDTVIVGDVTYVVHSIETAKTVGNEYLNETADGIYLIVNMTITNNGSKELTVSDSFFNILHGEAEYSADSAASIYLNEESSGFWLESINPGLSKTGKVAFDVTDAVAAGPGTQIKVQTGYWGTETEIITLN